MSDLTPDKVRAILDGRTICPLRETWPDLANAYLAAVERADAAEAEVDRLRSVARGYGVPSDLIVKEATDGR